MILKLIVLNTLLHSIKLPESVLKLCVYGAKRQKHTTDEWVVSGWGLAEHCLK